MAHIQVHQIHDDIRSADNNFYRQMFLTGAFEHLLSQYFLLRICIHGLFFSGAINLINAVGIGLYIAFVHLMLQCMYITACILPFFIARFCSCSKWMKTES